MRAAKKLAADKSIPIDDICETLKISRSTYYRYLALRAFPRGVGLCAVAPGVLATGDIPCQLASILTIQVIGSPCSAVAFNVASMW